MQEALVALRKAAELAPQDPAIISVLAIALHDTGDLEAAIATLDRALSLRPHDDALRHLRDRYTAEGEGSSSP